MLTHCRRGHELTGENVYARGRKKHCRACRRENSRRWQSKNREQVRTYDRQRRGSESTEEARARYQTTPELQRKARGLLKTAVVRGKVKKPTRCDGCGSETPKAKLHGHHEDYGRPLDVSWLCPACHGLTWRKEVTAAS